MTVRISAPAGLTAVGNRRLLARATRAGRTTFGWDGSKPMATYLAAITLGHFAVHRATAGHIAVYVAFDPDEAAAARPATDRIAEIIAWGAIAVRAVSRGYRRMRIRTPARAAEGPRDTP